MASSEEDKQLERIASLKEQAIEKYEELKTENVKTKDEYDKVKQERDEAVKKLEEFSKISHMVIEEVSFIQNHLEIEKTCRESAEALASKLNKENKTLKRISMLYMAKLGPDVITEEINIDDDDPSSEGDSGVAVCTSLECQRKIKELQEQAITLQEEKKNVSIELDDLRSKLVDIIEEVNNSKKENVMLTKEVFEQRKLLEKCNRVSVLAVEEYEDMQNSLEVEKNLREKAESLAQEMYIEQNQLKRQSCLLLQNCAPNEQLLTALDENAKLTHLLEEERIQHQLKIKELEVQLDEAKLKKELQKLQKQLELLEEDKKELEAKCQTSESTVKDLKHSVEELQKRVHQAENPAPPPPPPPPPLPPPPPPNPIRSLMSMIRKRPGASANASKKETALQPEAGTMVDLKRQAVDEMMDRIKKGVHLRPVNQASRMKNKQSTAEAAAPPVVRAEESKQPKELKSSNTAVQELKGILDTMNSSGNVRKLRGLGTASTETELERILRRRKVTTEQDPSSPSGTLTSLESKSMPVLGSQTNSPLRQNAKESEFKSPCRRPAGGEPMLFKEKQIHEKVASQSTEKQSFAGKKDKAENSDSSVDIALQSDEKTHLTHAEVENTADKKTKETNISNC